MMPFVAVLAFLALVVCLLDLVLTHGVIRRLPQHTDLISQLSGQIPHASGQLPCAILAEGKTAGPFEAVATTGEPLSRDRLSRQTLVRAFTPHCSACEEGLPGFVCSEKKIPGGREQVVAILVRRTRRNPTASGWSRLPALSSSRRWAMRSARRWC